MVALDKLRSYIGKRELIFADNVIERQIFGKKHRQSAVCTGKPAPKFYIQMLFLKMCE